jgi:hypothetical protein
MESGEPTFTLNRELGCNLGCNPGFYPGSLISLFSACFEVTCARVGIGGSVVRSVVETVIRTLFLCRLWSYAKLNDVNETEIKLSLQ